MVARQKRVTAKDVAALAGVSQPLVSMYLRKNPKAWLSEATKRRIDEAVKTLGYRRNEAAAEVRAGTCKTVALIYDFSHPATSGVCAGQIMLGVLSASSQNGYGVKIYDASDLRRSFDEILSYGIQYALCFSFTKEYQREIGAFCAANAIKLCYLQETCVEDVPLVYSDDRDATRSLARLFYERGHRRMALLIPDDDVMFSVNRKAGWLAGLKESGLKTDPKFISARKEPNDHYKDIERMLALPANERPTAFVCSDDTRAMRVQFTAMKMGINIPLECEVSGFGNVAADSFYYPVYTVDQSFKEIGSIALETVINAPQTAPEKNTLKRLLPTRIIKHNGAVNL